MYIFFVFYHYYHFSHTLWTSEWIRSVYLMSRISISSLTEILEENHVQVEFRELTQRTLIPTISLIPAIFIPRANRGIYSPDVISFPRFPPSSHRSPRPSRVATRGAGWKKKTRQRIANHESHEIASSVASQRQTRPMLKKPLSAHYRL